MTTKGKGKAQPRALTEILRSAGQETIYDVHGNQLTKSEQLASLMWSMACNGSVVFPDTREVKASARDWKDVSAWIYSQLDGPPRTELAITDGLREELRATPTDDLRALVEIAIKSKAATSRLHPEPVASGMALEVQQAEALPASGM